ncbi:MAG: hypothetical protein WB819_03475 [Terriglobia bacterium]
MGSAIFDTVPKRDYLSLFSGGRTDYKKVVRLLDFNKRDIAKASHVPLNSVRYDQKIPKELEQRLNEWATALAAVAQHFKDTQKTVLWFKIPNPLLGNVAPREMLRVGRFNKLHRFILNALSENEPPAK